MLRLRIHAGRVQEESDDFFVGNAAGIYGSMDTGVWLVPLGHAWMHRDKGLLARSALLDPELVTAYNHREPAASVSMPRHRFAWVENESPDHQIVPLRDHFHPHNARPLPRVISVAGTRTVAS